MMCNDFDEVDFKVYYVYNSVQLGVLRIATVRGKRRNKIITLGSLC